MKQATKSAKRPATKRPIFRASVRKRRKPQLRNQGRSPARWT